MFMVLLNLSTRRTVDLLPSSQSGINSFEESFDMVSWLGQQQNRDLFQVSVIINNL